MVDKAIAFFEDHAYANGLTPLFTDYLAYVPRIKWLPESTWARAQMIAAADEDLQRYYYVRRLPGYCDEDLAQTEPNPTTEVSSEAEEEQEEAEEEQEEEEGDGLEATEEDYPLESGGVPEDSFDEDGIVRWHTREQSVFSPGRMDDADN